MNHVSPERRVVRVRHELRRREVTVARVEPVGAGFVAVTFSGEALADFTSLSFDDHIKFMVELPGGELLKRDYTPRRFDAAARELTLEFALHGPGQAADWARHAVPGLAALIGGPRGSMIIPTDVDWHLLAGDSSALPAIRRRLDELPAGVRAIVVVQGDEASPLGAAACAATLELHQADSADDLIATLAGLRLPPGDGFAWCAGEAATMARVRQVLVDPARLGLAREAIRVSAYWKRGASAFHETLDQ